MKYRTMSGCVTVTGPPRAICSRKIGTTLPEESSTLPNRTVTSRHAEAAALACTNSSASRLHEPMTLVGFTALSVETMTNASTSNSSARSASVRVASTMLRTASATWASISGTCL